MAPSRIVVIGTSAGGLEILNELMEQLPEKLPAAVFFLHMAATSSAEFFGIQLQKYTRYTCKVAKINYHIQEGPIYLASADHQLRISGKLTFENKGPRENQLN